MSAKIFDTKKIKNSSKKWPETIDKIQKIVYNVSCFRGYGSVGRAVRSQRTGHEFESRYLHQTRIRARGIAPFLLEKTDVDVEA